MKPHIFKSNGVWFCSGGNLAKAGDGNSPIRAYISWMKRDYDASVAWLRNRKA